MHQEPDQEPASRANARPGHAHKVLGDMIRGGVIPSALEWEHGSPIVEEVQRCPPEVESRLKHKGLPGRTELTLGLTARLVVLSFPPPARTCPDSARRTAPCVRSVLRVTDGPRVPSSRTETQTTVPALRVVRRPPDPPHGLRPAVPSPCAMSRPIQVQLSSSS